jgi:hypothetical protein
MTRRGRPSKPCWSLPGAVACSFCSVRPSACWARLPCTPTRLRRPSTSSRASPPAGHHSRKRTSPGLRWLWPLPRAPGRRCAGPCLSHPCSRNLRAPRHPGRARQGARSAGSVARLHRQLERRGNPCGCPRLGRHEACPYWYRTDEMHIYCEISASCAGRRCEPVGTFSRFVSAQCSCPRPQGSAQSP